MTTPAERGIVRRLVAHLRPHWHWLGLIFFVDLLAAPLALLAPLPLKIAVDNVIGG